MTVSSLIQALNAKIFNLADGERVVSTGYAGDLLSHVMGKAPEGGAWFTIMTNINVCAVATLTDVAVVVVCEDSVPDELFVERAKEQEINLISTKSDIFQAIEIYIKSSQA